MSAAVVFVHNPYSTEGWITESITEEKLNRARLEESDSMTESDPESTGTLSPSSAKTKNPRDHHDSPLKSPSISSSSSGSMGSSLSSTVSRLVEFREKHFPQQQQQQTQPTQPPIVAIVARRTSNPKVQDPSAKTIPSPTTTSAPNPTKRSSNPPRKNAPPFIPASAIRVVEPPRADWGSWDPVPVAEYGYYYGPPMAYYEEAPIVPTQYVVGNPGMYQPAATPGSVPVGWANCQGGWSEVPVIAPSAAMMPQAQAYPPPAEMPHYQYYDPLPTTPISHSTPTSGRSKALKIESVRKPTPTSPLTPTANTTPSASKTSTKSSGK